jgi:hypothetical protein
MKSIFSQIGNEINRQRLLRSYGKSDDIAADLVDLYASIGIHQGRIPVSWARSTHAVPYSNLGDQLSATVVSAITRQPTTHVEFNAPDARLLAIGSIGHQQTAGTVHIWGTGFGSSMRNASGLKEPFLGFPDVRYRVHALRGPYSANLLKNIGLPSSEVYGDPAWFLPRIFQSRPGKRYELGVIPHLSELEQRTPAPRPKPTLKRYVGGESDGIKLISTFHEPSWDGFQSKIEEILSCERIISRSLHGMIIADAFKIPCLYISPTGGGPERLSIDADERALDKRFADAYAGFGAVDVLSYGMPRTRPTDWGKVVRAIDDYWEPISFTGEELLASFPLPKAVTFDQQDWSMSERLISTLEW